MWKSKRRSHYDGSGLNRSLVHQHDPIGSEFRLASEFAERPAARKPCARAQLTLKRTNSRHRQFSRARGAHDNPSQPSHCDSVQVSTSAKIAEPKIVKVCIQYPLVLSTGPSQSYPHTQRLANYDVLGFPTSHLHISSRGLCATETPKARHILDILNSETGAQGVRVRKHMAYSNYFDIKSRIHSREPLTQSHGPMIDNKQDGTFCILIMFSKATQCAIATANRNTRAK
ncbi:hypothetical protein CISG_06054 [Coccidioides immitis RMSCC 3703]|uniref:Uncharacterized protein n=1 Tax=Coccidioides immitis RMSCC 3703 TaxID=454286 RepID=A0A0J8QYU0_COCIT|nr:hypothetical protein CISG_06054 [Coccidioides immitis RMSCC 3703]